MSDYKELFEKTFDSQESLKNELHEYYFPECEFIYTSSFEEDLEKYSWCNFIILKYFGQLYRINIKGYGNGGWLSIDDFQITSIKKVKKVETVITYTQVTYEEI